MAARTFEYAESTGESTTNSTSFVDKTTLTFTPDDNSDYILFWSALIQEADATWRCQARLFDDTDSTELLFVESTRQDPTNDWQNIGGIAKETYGASPGSQTYKIQFRSITSARTVKIKEARLFAIKLVAADESAVSEGDSTTTSATKQVKTTLTFTPGSTGDYLLFASAEFQNSLGGETRRADFDLNHGGTLYGDGGEQGQGSSPWSTFVKLNLAASSQTFEIRFASGFALNTVTIRRARIVALRLDEFDNSYYGESRGNSTTTSSSYQDKVTLTETPENLQHLVLTGALHGSSGTGESRFVKAIEDAVDLAAETVQDPEFTTEDSQFLVVEKRTPTAASHTWKIQFHSESGTSVSIEEAAIAVLQLEASGGGISVSPAAASAVGAKVDPTIVLGSHSATPTPASAIAGRVNPAIVLGSVSVTPDPAAAVGATPFPVVINNEILTPAAASAIGAKVDPTVILGAVNVVPVAAFGVGATPDPTVQLGSLTLAPGAAAAIAGIVDPTVIEGGIVVAPAAASAVGAKVDPNVVLGSTTATPAPAVGVGGRADPMVQLGSITVSPAAAAALAAKVDPTIVLGSVIIIPTPAGAIAFTPDPGVILGSQTVIPAAVTVVADKADPVVIEGGLFVTPLAASAVAETLLMVVISEGESILFDPTFDALFDFVRKAVKLFARDRPDRHHRKK